MMNASELMIGDYVRITEPNTYAGNIGKILSLVSHKEDEGAYFSVFHFGEKGIGRIDVFNEDIKPIPITPEILEKVGFSRKGSNHFFLEYGSYGALACYPLLGGDTEIFFQKDNASLRNRIRYVHELQHSLKSCSIDKEIKL